MARITIDAETAFMAFKAGLLLPPGAQVTTEAQARAQSQALALGGAGSDVSMPRGEAFVGWPFGPGMPIPPSSIGPRTSDGGALPRRWEFPVSWNIPGIGEPEVPFDVLRQVAKVDIVRRCLEVRKEQLASLDWDIVPRNDAVDQMARTAGDSRHKVKRAMVDDLSDDISRIREAFQTPDKINGLPFGVWLSSALEEHFVLDAIAIKPWERLGGDVSMVVIDGSTIKPLLDANGNRPGGGQVAYQQHLYGFPRGDYTASVDAAADFTADELVYAVRHARSFSPYGFSMVESCLGWVDLWLRRKDWLQKEFTEGTQARGYMRTNKAMTPEQIRAYNYVFNQTMAGNTAERFRTQVLPDGFDPVTNTEFAEKFQPHFDRWILNNLCALLGVNPGELGFEPEHGGLGGKGHAEGSENVTYRRDYRPTIVFVRGLLDHIARRYFGMNPLLTFSFLGAEVEDTALDSKTDDTNLKNGSKTLNDIRAKNGDPLYDLPEADEPMVITATGPVFIKGSLPDPNAPTPPGAPPGPGGQPTGASAGDPATPSPEQGGSRSQPPPQPPVAPPAMQAEATKFLNAVRHGVRRPFVFRTGLAAHAETLHAAAASGDREAVKVAIADVLKASGGGADPKDRRRHLAASFRSTHGAIAKDAAPHIARATSGLIDRAKLLDDLQGIVSTPR